MVAKKRCDFCLKIKSENLQTDQKVLNKEIRDVLLKISGVPVESEQLATILICFDCAISLIQAEPIAIKARTLLTRLSKQKAKKKKTPIISVDDNVDASASMLEKSTLHENGESSMDTGNLKKTPQRRKSIAKKLVDSVVNEELEGSPAASSTMAVNASIIEGNETPKETPLKKPKSRIKANDKNTPQPKKSVKRRTSENSQGEKNDSMPPPISATTQDSTMSPKKTAKRTFSEQSDRNSREEGHHDYNKAVKHDENENIKLSPKKSLKVTISEGSSKEESAAKKIVKRKISEKSEHNSQEENNELIRTPKKDDSKSMTPVTPTKTVKRKISERSDTNSQEESNTIVKPFKKMKDTDAENLDLSAISNSQHSMENGDTFKECNDCGKIFRHLDRYEAHVSSQKCKLAAHECKHPDCMRRFFKLQKMLEHMQRKHPEMQDNDMD